MKTNEEDYNFDFSEYEQEAKEENNLEDINNNTKPKITGFRSKFSMGISELQSLANIKDKISEYGIKVAARTDEVNDLWKLYGCLNEYWARIHDIFGTVNIKEIENIQVRSIKLLKKYGNKGKIPYIVHEYLLYYRDVIYKLSQRINLGIEITKNYRNKQEHERRITE